MVYSRHRWQAKEVEAYEIQHKYLKKMRVTRSFIELDTMPITCPEDKTVIGERGTVNGER